MKVYHREAILCYHQTMKKVLAIILLTLIPTLLIWMPFFFRFKTFWNIPLPNSGMATVVANFDGPLYLVVAKTLYNPELIGGSFQFPLSNEYYTAHFPLFPLLIKSFAAIFGFPYSMLFVTIVSTFFALYFFFKLASSIDNKSALWLTAIFAVLPARWLIVRSVGSAEPLFIAATFASLYYFNKKQYLWAGLFGAISAMTKSPGILLFVAYLLTLTLPNIRDLAVNHVKSFISKMELNKSYWLLLIPIGLLSVFSFYYVKTGDFWVYFKSGDNIHLFFPPFQIFNYSAPWVGTFWLEEVIFIYIIGAIGVYRLKMQGLTTLYYYSLIYFTSLLFVAHRDLLRYALPIIPLILISFKDLLISKEFKIAMSVAIIPIYLYSLAFISQNAMPIANWTPFL
jgi:Gpi18-like mannosyltransferase